MANQRAADQEFVGIWISKSLAAKINTARNGVARSNWLRDAIADFLIKSGFSVSHAEKNAPDRVGKKIAIISLIQKAVQ